MIMISPARRLLLAVAILTLAMTAPASADGLFTFGNSEQLNYIMPTNILDEGRPLSLGYKTTRLNVLFPVWVTANGYVLFSGINAQQYYPLSAADIASYQASGLLPRPMPSLGLSLLDIIWGFSGWITLPLALGLAILSALSRHQQTD